ncbi:MAG TPA: nucleotidyltransferase [Thermoanaerobaculia bacterium]|nr:nucleotidyltransferase [Thermoanaerobaculia bacterium]
MTSTASLLAEESRDFYRQALRVLNERGVPYLVGGAYAYARYTGIERHTKDFDVFIRRTDYGRAAEAFEQAGYETDLVFPHWLGKAFQGEDFIDLIFSSGNGVAEVDDEWFENAVPAKVLGMDVTLIPPEEMIWSKGLIMERERFDGADVAHILHSEGERLNWDRLARRFGPHWRVLYAHLVLFGFIYPFERSKIPARIMDHFGEKLAAETHRADEPDKVCFGTILSRQQYLTDVGKWRYRDARLGRMSPEEIAHWTAAIDRDGDE